ncbi:general stress protein [Georgenia sp. Z1344]|uniref:general stress protein n=1 Tax=Georgenia sp. Z1344 TaxID=3416706 RepID=UPI003CF4A12A
MSIQNQPLGARALSIPTGVQLAAYSSYEDAQRAVDHLSDTDHDVRLVSIVGEDLRLVERITGRLDYGKVAGSGALTGAWFGLMMALVMWLVIGNFGLVDFVIPVLVGAAFGVLLGIVSYAVRPKTRDFTSSSTVVAKRYVIIAGPTVADEMRAALQKEGLLGNAPAAQQGAGAYGAGQGAYGVSAHGAPQHAGGPAGTQGQAGAPGHGGMPGHAGTPGTSGQPDGGQDAWTPGARGEGATGSHPAGTHDAGASVHGGHDAGTPAYGAEQPAGAEAGADSAPRPAPAGFEPTADGAPRYGARLEDLTPDQRAHAEAQLRAADEHRGAAENRTAPDAGGHDQQ